MKIIDCLPTQKSAGWQQVRERVQATLKQNAAGQASLEAQAAVADRMARILPDTFTALRGLTLPGIEQPLSLVVVGPPGVFAILVSAVRGIFRAKDTEWAAVTGQDKFRPANPNLLRQAALHARALQDRLRQGNYTYPAVEPVLVGVDPGLHVDSIHPVARVVLADGIDRFADSLRVAAPVISADEVEEIASLLAGEGEPAPEIGIFEQDRGPAADDIFREIAPEVDFEPEPDLTPAPPQPLPGGLTRSQLLFLIVLGALNLIVIAGFVIFLMLSN